MLNYGKFFKLNNEKSDLSKGITVFDYIWLKNDNANGSEETPEYPIYVVVTKECIEFKVHFYAEALETKKVHLHNTILELPFSANIEVKDGLTRALAEGYETIFPHSENTYLSTLIQTIVQGENRTEVSYSHLKEFNIDFSNTPINCFIRKLILDFMFDLEQTKVFQTSPHYEHISVKLKENYFFSALAAKANFYYWREIIDKEVKPIIQKLNTIEKDILALYPYDGHNYTNQAIEEKLEEKRETENQLNKLKVVYIEYYLKAKMQWEKAIRSSKAEENFNGYEDEWFCDPEIEMNNVRISWIVCWCYYFRKILKEKKTTTERYETRKLEHKIFDLIKKKEDKKTQLFTDNFIERIDNNKQLSDKWQQRHYYLWHNGWQWVWMPRLLISIAAAWLTFILGSNLWGNLENGSFQTINPSNLNWVCIFCFVLIISSIVWIGYLGVKHKIQKVKSLKKICQFSTGTFYLTLWGFIYSALLGAALRIFVYESKKGVFEGDFCTQWKYWCGKESYFYWITVCIAMFVGLVVQSFMDKKSPADEL